MDHGEEESLVVYTRYSGISLTPYRSESIVHARTQRHGDHRDDREGYDICELLYSSDYDEDCEELSWQIESYIYETLEEYDDSHDCEEDSRVELSGYRYECRWLRYESERYESPDDEIDSERDEWEEIHNIHYIDISIF